MCYRDFLFFITICKYMPVYKQDLHGSWTGIGQDCPQTVDIFFLFLDLLCNIGKDSLQIGIFFHIFRNFLISMNYGGMIG